MGELAKTPLYDWHVAHGGRLVDFAGWSMPVQYSSIVAEHNATRTAAGLFDVSHMGRFAIEGTGATAFLDRVLTRRVSDMTPGRIRYSLVCNEQGGILDDVLLYLLEDGAKPKYQLVVNASNRDKIFSWLEKHRGAAEVSVVDKTRETAMIAVQGPKAIGLLQPLIDCELASMKYYTGAATNIAGARGLVSRTGYTGEDGCELVVPADAAAAIWERILADGGSIGATAAGLGARDTLRLEAAMPLYGHELSETINPVQAGLGFAYNLKDRKFLGRDAIARFQDDANQPRRVGLELSSKRVPREGFAVYAGDKNVGDVTSGTFSPTLQKPIAMAYVRPEHSESGTNLEIDIRGSREPATVVPLPFYKRS